MFLFFEGFQPQNVIIYETFLPVNGENYSLRSQFSLIGYTKYFNDTLEVYKMIHPDEISLYIALSRYSHFCNFFYSFPHFPNSK